MLCFPLVLIWNCLRIYVFSCFAVLFTRAYRLLCRPCLSCCWLFTDDSFEGSKAVGEDKVEWVRAVDLLDGRPKLYEGKIEPADLCQGSVGDCWLVAALACAAEHPGAIRKAFVSYEANPRGAYSVRLFDPDARAWVTVKVDDRIPCRPGTKDPLYMKVHGAELWAVLLEKAFAKFCGSYQALDGGWAVWGWRVLTGDHCFRLKLGDGGAWTRLNFEAKRPKAGGDEGIGGAFRSTTEAYSSQQVWIGSSSSGGGGHQQQQLASSRQQ